mmetsp:Transcript_57143/g.63855  ORF Transcript_57143/g.63855 Transcript_57143/m.63855 type:complete len:81 (-) Transcript_57143:36-278(-)
MTNGETNTKVSGLIPGNGNFGRIDPLFCRVVVVRRSNEMDATAMRAEINTRTNPANNRNICGMRLLLFMEAMYSRKGILF